MSHSRQEMFDTIFGKYSEELTELDDSKLQNVILTLWKNKEAKQVQAKPSFEQQMLTDLRKAGLPEKTFITELNIKLMLLLMRIDDVEVFSKTMDILSKEGFDWNAKKEGFITEQKIDRFNIADFNSFLHTLIAMEEIDLLGVIVEKSLAGKININWNAVDAQGKTAFELLLMVRNEKHHEYAKKLLLARDLKPPIDLIIQDYKGNTPAHIAAYLGLEEIFHIIVGERSLKCVSINYRSSRFNRPSK